MSRKPLLVFFLFAIFFKQASFSYGADEFPAALSDKAAGEGQRASKLEREIYATRMENPARVVETLKIEPDMVVLDLGAGAGNFTFAFADILKNGSGRVFATDCDSEMIDFINTKITKKNYTNVTSVLVDKEGLDSFYKTPETFDVIFMSRVYDNLGDPQGYMTALKPSLKKGGRLFIIHLKTSQDFSLAAFGGCRYIFKILNKGGEDSPFFKRLNKESKEVMKNLDQNAISGEVCKDIITSFNSMLYDRGLYRDCDAYYRSNGISWKNAVYLEDRRLLFTLATWLDEDGVFDDGAEISQSDMRLLRKLNEIIITGAFVPRSRFHPAQKSYAEKDRIISTLEKAGYEFVCEYNFLSKYYFLEFKAKNE